MLILRFDFRLKPDSPTTMQELYGTALDMCQWGERNNAATVMFSEHHSSPDGYLPSPIVMAAAAAARTEALTFNVGALLLLMYDPIKLAEDIAVLDHLSGGRIGYTIGLGYREEEQMKATVVPNRNAIFSSILYGYGLSIATQEDTDVSIALGIHSGDHAIYPDCRPEFYQSLGVSI